MGDGAGERGAGLVRLAPWDDPVTARNRPEIEGAAGEPTSPWPAEPEARRRRHGELRERIAAVLADESDLIARMATAASLLFEEMPHASFVGFYRAHPGETLVIGPYQGPLACLRIPFGRGVCGTAATEGRSILVPDVHAFPGTSPATPVPDPNW